MTLALHFGPPNSTSLGRVITYIFNLKNPYHQIGPPPGVKELGLIWAFWTITSEDFKPLTQRIGPTSRCKSAMRTTSNTSREPWLRNCVTMSRDYEPSPKESLQRPSQHTSKIMQCGHGPSSVVWSHMWPGPTTRKSANNNFVYDCDFCCKGLQWL
jgi:hypothetical protein